MGYITVGLITIVFGALVWMAGVDETGGYWTPVEVVGVLVMAAGALLVLVGMLVHYLAVRYDVEVRRPPLG